MREFNYLDIERIIGYLINLIICSVMLKMSWYTEKPRKIRHMETLECTKVPKMAFKGIIAQLFPMMSTQRKREQLFLSFIQAKTIPTTSSRGHLVIYVG